MKKFVVTQQHLDLIKNFIVGYNDEAEFGAPEIDPKRPYGNSDVYSDMAEILGLEPGDEFDKDYIEIMDRLHRETANVLQIACVVGYFKVGEYEASDYKTDWRPKQAS